MEILDKKSNRMSRSNELFFTFYEFATAHFFIRIQLKIEIL